MSRPGATAPGAAFAMATTRADGNGCGCVVGEPEIVGIKPERSHGEAMENAGRMEECFLHAVSFAETARCFNGQAADPDRRGVWLSGGEGVFGIVFSTGTAKRSRPWPKLFSRRCPM